MTEIRLDARLQTVADLVRAGEPMADIGTDHAYLPVHLLQKGICPSAVAVEKVKGPYQSAKRLVDTTGMTDCVDVRLGDGLAPLSPGEVSTVVMAGMGGRLIAEIWERGKNVLAQTVRIVCQPQKNPECCRLWLQENGWTILAERIAADRHFFYPIIVAEKGSMRLTEQELLYGAAERYPVKDELRAYLQHCITELQTLQQELEHKPGDAIDMRRRALQDETERLQAMLQAIC